VVKDHPSGDQRFARIEAVLKRHQYRADALIEVLHTAQEVFGCLADDLLLYVAQRLQAPPSRVYGVATFYHFFSLKPKGEHTCTVCMGTACYVKGGAQLLAAALHEAHLAAEETTPDGKLTLNTARCLGACGIAPAMVLDGSVVGKQSEEDVVRFIKGCLAHGAV
jgi:bidirectional [NiFe] hydrogenase diaphorase subunit